jgi:hypothetical protein
MVLVSSTHYQNSVIYNDSTFFDSNSTALLPCRYWAGYAGSCRANHFPFLHDLLFESRPHTCIFWNGYEGA